MGESNTDTPALGSKIIAYFRHRLSLHFPGPLHAAHPHGSLPHASAAPENPSASLSLLLLAARKKD